MTVPVFVLQPQTIEPLRRISRALLPCSGPRTTDSWPRYIANRICQDSSRCWTFFLLFCTHAFLAPLYKFYVHAFPWRRRRRSRQQISVIPHRQISSPKVPVLCLCFSSNCTEMTQAIVCIRQNSYLLTPRYRVLLDKLNGLQLVKKFPSFHGTRRFITALTSVRHLSISWARRQNS